jgi:hypothetical protein
MAVSIIFYFIFNIVYFLKNNYSPKFFLEEWVLEIAIQRLKHYTIL